MELIDAIATWLWNFPLVILLLGTGLYLTILLNFVQVREFIKGWKLIFKGKTGADAPGEITPFQALTTALSATIGTGNIAGVATAIATGGPGALFWMWVTAVVGMATKYAEAILAVKFRVEDEKGWHGGPMYYLERGLRWRTGGVLFALFGTVAAFGIGNMVQSNSVAVAVDSFIGGSGGSLLERVVTGVVLMVCAGMVIIGGLRRIASVAERLVPFMALLYVAGGTVIILKNAHLIPHVLTEILTQAFTPKAGKGFVIGLLVQEAVRAGVARGLFSNESGLGSAPIAHAASKVKKPREMAAVAMMGPFIDTIVVCSITGFAILLTQADTSKFVSSDLTAEAFRIALGGAGQAIVTIGLILFAYSTILGWFYYGQQCFLYLTGSKWDGIYKVIFVVLVGIGSVLEVKFIWTLSDLMNALMAFPNLIGLIGLSFLVRRLSREPLN